MAAVLAALGLGAGALVAAVPTVGEVAGRAGPGFGLPGAVSAHVVVVSVDGLRPDAVARFGLKTVERLMREGAYTLEAQTVLPSKTLPAHTSMLTGVPPAEHGVTWNSDEVAVQGLVRVPTVFELARAHGLRTAAFFSKSKFRHLQKPGTLDYTRAPSGAEKWLATQTVEDAVSYLEHARPNLLFVHLGEPDYAGHVFGWMSVVYGWAARRADSGIAALLEAADRAFGRGNYTVIVTSDHGGHGRDHGSADPRDVTIPWVVWGRRVQAGVRLGPGVRTMDTAATALWLLGVPVPRGWTGRPVVEAFSPEARAVASRAAAAAAAAAAGAAPARRAPAAGVLRGAPAATPAAPGV